MEFKFTAEHEALRAEVRAFLRENLPPSLGPTWPTSHEQWPEQMAFNSALASRQWVAPAWPKLMNCP